MDSKSGLKYDMLTFEELEQYKKEFIQYLALNGIEQTDWDRIKQEEKAKVKELLIDFSNGIWSHRLSKLKYINFIRAHQVLCFYFGDKTVQLNGLTIPEEISLPTELDLTSFQSFISEHISSLRGFQQKKAYIGERNKELFELLKSGALIADGELFKLVGQLTSKK